MSIVCEAEAAWSERLTIYGMAGASLSRRSGESVNLWLDDVRNPVAHGCIGFTWAKTAEEAIGYLRTGQVKFASLDHDLTERQTLGEKDGVADGMDVIIWMIANQKWPPKGVAIHSVNEKWKPRMEKEVLSEYGNLFAGPGRKKL